jgi:hypothetical protein
MVGSTAPVTLSLRVDALSADGRLRRALKPSEALHSGDKIALGIDVDRPAAVYVVQALPDGGLEVLYPQVGAQTKSGPLRIPSAGQWLEPDGNTCQEELFVVASLHPFPLLERDLCASLGRSPCALAQSKPELPPANRDLDTRGVRSPPPPPPPPPPNMDVATRGMGSGYSMRARSNTSGVAVLQLTLQHGR